MALVRLHELADPRLADFAHRTDVELRAARSSGPGIFLVESLLVLERALAAGFVPRSVLVLENSAAAAEALMHAHPGIPLFVAADQLATELTGYQLHRGVVASFERPALREPESLLGGARRLVVIDDVVDPTNVGAIFRSVAGIGADAVLVSPRCADPFYRRAIRVSMGTVLQVPWTRAPAWPELATALREHGFEVAALALTDEAVPLRDYAQRAPERLALVLGTEGAGLGPEALAAADVHVQIPMRHGVDSLNVAAAAAVAIYALT